MSTDTHVAPCDKLRSYKPRHLVAIIAELNKSYNLNLTGAETQSAEYLANMIKLTANNHQINQAHRDAVRNYNNNQDRGYYRKGRPLGSKNKNGYTTQPKSDLNNILSDLDVPSPVEPPSVAPVVSSPVAQNMPADVAKISDLQNIITDILQRTFTEYTKTTDNSFNQVNSRIGRVEDNLFSTNKLIGENFDTLSKSIAAIKNFTPTIVEFQRPNLPKIDLGIQHKMFPLLLQMCSARQRNGFALNIWVHGPAGTGKSTAAENVATALNLSFHTTGSLGAPHEVLGFNNAHNYVTTSFRQAWEHGGVYCLDEADGSSPQAMLALNGALAGSWCNFPDKLVKRHPDCIIIATANTTGQGASTEYSGRFKQDAANMDRFVTLHWPIDEALEGAMCANQEWVARVRQMRANLAKSSIKGVMITPRATLYGEALLAAGIPQSVVEQSVLQKSMDAAQWAMINQTR